MSLTREVAVLIAAARMQLRSKQYGRGSLSPELTLFLAIVVSAFSAGCDRFFLPKPPETQDGSYLVHVVSGGEEREDIGTILLWYTGSEDTLAALQTANPGVDLSALQPGQRIMIPSSVVIQTNAMPRRKFTLGTDAPPPVMAPPTAESAPHRASKSDPLEELMRKQESRAPQQPTPPRAVGVPPTASNLGDAPTPPLVEQNKPVAPRAPKAISRERKLEAFSEDEVGALPQSGSQPRSPENGSTGDDSGKPGTSQIKNPRPRRVSQPEVFEEE